MTREILKEYHEKWNDCWKLFRVHAEQEEIQWENLVKESRKLRIKYKEDKFVCDILLAFYRELERIEKK